MSKQSHVRNDGMPECLSASQKWKTADEVLSFWLWCNSSGVELSEWMLRVGQDAGPRCKIRVPFESFQFLLWIKRLERLESVSNSQSSFAYQKPFARQYCDWNHSIGYRLCYIRTSVIYFFRHAANSQAPLQQCRKDLGAKNPYTCFYRHRF